MRSQKRDVRFYRHLSFFVYIIAKIRSQKTFSAEKTAIIISYNGCHFILGIFNRIFLKYYIYKIILSILSLLFNFILEYNQRLFFFFISCLYLYKYIFEFRFLKYITFQSE